MKNLAELKNCLWVSPAQKQPQKRNTGKTALKIYAEAVSYTHLDVYKRQDLIGVERIDIFHH